MSNHLPDPDYFVIKRADGCYRDLAAWTDDLDMAELFAADDQRFAGEGERIGVMFTNEYHCAECDAEWTDQWTCGCDDECPVCGCDISPVESEREEVQ